ncbi:MAG: Yip1 family protein [Desulfosalsimonadaceae bacterium]
MEREPNVQFDIQKELKGIVPSAIEIITKPDAFFSRMAKTGGFLQPLLFMVILGTASAIISWFLSLIGFGPAGARTSILLTIILVPILIAIVGFISAAILFVIWKLMGSQESYETAYRGMAYTAAILPITAVLNIIPYIGTVVGLLWLTYLLVVISITVHSIKAKTAWVGFGIICAVLVIFSLSTEFAARRMMREMESWQRDSRFQSESMEEMTPEEISEAMAEFLKSMQENRE